MEKQKNEPDLVDYSQVISRVEVLAQAIAHKRLGNFKQGVNEKFGLSCRTWKDLPFESLQNLKCPMMKMPHGS